MPSPTNVAGGFFGFAAVTFFFLGPLGPGFALLATHGEIEKSQLQAVRADADSYYDDEDAEFSDAPVVKAPPTPTPVPAPPAIDPAKRTVICPLCDAEQRIPATAGRFTCGRCKEISKAPV